MRIRGAAKPSFTAPTPRQSIENQVATVNVTVQLLRISNWKQ